MLMKTASHPLKQGKFIWVPALKSHFPLVVGMTFFGSIPHYGISYTDENGSSKQFAIEQSGDDGSILLTEF